MTQGIRLSAFDQALPNPAEDLLQAAASQTDLDPFVAQVAGIMRDVQAVDDGKGPELDTVWTQLDTALAHPACHRRLRCCLLILATRLAMNQRALDTAERLEAEAKSLIAEQDGPAFAALPWQTAWRRAIAQQDPELESQAKAALARHCAKAGGEVSEAWIDYLGRRVWADLARHRLGEAQAGLAELESLGDRCSKNWHPWSLPQLSMYYHLEIGDYSIAADKADTPLRKAEVALSMNDRERLDQALQVMPKDSPVRYYYEGEWALRSHKPERAQSYLERIQQSTHANGFHAVILAQSARIALARRRGREAEIALKKLDPSSQWGSNHVLWMTSAWFQGDGPRAAAHLKALEAAGPLGYRIRQLAGVPSLSAADLEGIRHAELPQNPPKITAKPREVPQQGATFIGESAATQAIRRRITLLAPHQEAVLITGPTGSGKEVIARELHRQSCPADAPFIAINCAALPPSLAEAELFGHRKGAFTGADKDRPGTCDLAAGGVLFLDEIGSMAWELQALLLRLLETGDYQPIGGGPPRHLKARVISATNIPLGDLVAAQAFRDDLLFRLQRLSIDIHGLSQRGDDIEPLCRHFIRGLHPENTPEIDSSLIDFYRQQDWPGNVRELRNDLELMCILHGDEPRLYQYHSPLFQRHGEDPSTKSANPAEVWEKPLPPGGHKVAARQASILELAHNYGSIARRDVVAALGCAPGTAAKDLAALEEQGHLKRLIPNGAIRLTRFAPTSTS